MKDSGDNADGSQGKSQSARCMMYDIIVFENLHFLPPRFQSPLLLRPFSKPAVLKISWVWTGPFEKRFLSREFWRFFFLSDPGNPDLSAQDTDASGAATSNIPLTDEERLLLAYEPEDSDWLGEGRDAMTERLVAGLEALSQLNFAGPFVYPVDVHAYPDYWTVVPYPTDLSNLREKLLNKYYRYDLLYISFKLAIHSPCVQYVLFSSLVRRRRKGGSTWIVSAARFSRGQKTFRARRQILKSNTVE